MHIICVFLFSTFLCVLSFYAAIRSPSCCRICKLYKYPTHAPARNDSGHSHSGQGMKLCGQSFYKSIYSHYLCTSLCGIYLYIRIKHVSNYQDGNDVGKSGNAAKGAIKQVIPARIMMASPAMFVPPLIMSKLEKASFLIKNPWLKAPTTVLVTGKLEYNFLIIFRKVWNKFGKAYIISPNTYIYTMISWCRCQKLPLIWLFLPLYDRCMSHFCHAHGLRDIPTNLRYRHQRPGARAASEFERKISRC